MIEQYCKHEDRDYCHSVNGEIQDVCEKCDKDLTYKDRGGKGERPMKTKTDAPPTLPVAGKNGHDKAPKSKKPVVTRLTRTEKAASKLTPKEKLAALKAKKKADRPAVKITFGVHANGHYVFSKMNFDNPQEALHDLVKLCQPRLGKGLREVIISFRD